MLYTKLEIFVSPADFQLRLTPSASAGPMPLQSFKSYKNDLFGEEDGDVLAAETIPAAKPIESALPRPTTPSNRVQQQIALNQQKRLARLQVQLACSNYLVMAITYAQCVARRHPPPHQACQAACWLLTCQIHAPSCIWACTGFTIFSV